MRAIVVGLGIQGKKRSAIAGSELVATVDPVHPEANYKDLKDVPIEKYDAALVCTPDEAKVEILTYLLSNKKHVLVEKPLLTKNTDVLISLKSLAEKNKVTLYTAYNHRFEPHFVNLKKLIEKQELGKLYLAKFFYGNGTARDVRNSVWKDKGSGVLADIGSHLLDTIYFLFGNKVEDIVKKNFNAFENKSFDHVLFGTSENYKGLPALDLEATMLSWRNTFRLDLFAENGSAHIDCLCKWGPSTFTVRKRVLPSGVPPEEGIVLKCSDPTWKLEYDHFKNLTLKAENNTDADIWILKTLQKLGGNNL